MFALLNQLSCPPGTPEEEAKHYEGTYLHHSHYTVERDAITGMFLCFDSRNNTRCALDRLYYGRASQTPEGFIMGSVGTLVYLLGMTKLTHQKEYWGKELEDRVRKHVEERRQGIICPPARLIY